MGQVQTMKQKTHLDWIDFTRCIAICTVILIHVAQDTYSFGLDVLPTASLHTQLFEVCVFTVGRLGVPLFIFISGFLLLDRGYDREHALKFWKKNLLGLFITTEIWIVIYNIFLSWFNGIPFDGITLFQNLIFVKAVGFTHNPAWYMPMILGMYLFVPFVANALQKLDWKLYVFPMLIAFGYQFVMPVINIVRISMGASEDLVQLPGLEFGGGIYGFMLIMGFIKKKGIFDKIPDIIIYMSGIISFVIIVGIQIFCYEHYVVYQVWYNCAFILITSFCIFEVISRWKRIPLRRVMRNLAKHSFGIYLIHKPILMLFWKYVYIEKSSVRIAIISILLLLISWGCVWGISKIPKIGKILFFIR